MFICGSGSFSRQDEDDRESFGSPCSTPKRSKRSTSFSKIIGKDHSNKNRFAERGLDKFYALLADLDKRKQKIYTRMGSEDISFVRFVYTNDSNQVKPIVVKVNKVKKPDRPAIGKSIKKSPPNVSHQSAPAGPEATTVESQTRTENEANYIPKEEVINEKPRKKRRFLRCKGSFEMDSLRRPHLCLLVILVLVLVLLSINGRSFAILCTSIGWYVVPTIVGGGSSSDSSEKRKPKRKKEYVRRQSERKLVVHSEGPSSPKSVINGLVELK